MSQDVQRVYDVHPRIVQFGMTVEHNIHLIIPEVVKVSSTYVEWHTVHVFKSEHVVQFG